MSTDLYEILGIQADATPEQSVLLHFYLRFSSHKLVPVRKAYKKRALQTHPDRAPASDKAEAEEKFRQVGTTSVPHNGLQTKLASGKQRL